MARPEPTRAGTGEGRVRVLVNVVSPDLVPEDLPDEGSLRSLLDAGVRATLAEAGIRTGEISVTLIDDARIRELNRQYLDRDRPTDVLAFPLYEADEPLVGDVYLGAERARLQARERGIPWAEELLRLAIHGTLHVLGYEHPEGVPEGIEEGGEEGVEEGAGDGGRPVEGAREDSEMFRLQEVLIQRVLAGDGATDESPAEVGSSRRGDPVARDREVSE